MEDHIETNHIKVEKTARVSTYGNLSSKTRYLWMVLHGTKMKCEQVLYKFSDFDPDEHFVIAPEGLNRQYLKDFGGEAVATWMTSRDRLHEIENISHYLTEVFTHYKSLAPDHVKITIMGFSQGGTMTMRWLHRKKIELDHLIIYAGWIPEDINLSASKSDLNKIKMFYLYGTEDELITPQRIKMLESIIDKHDLNFRFMNYKEKHKINRKFLQNIFTDHILAT